MCSSSTPNGSRLVRALIDPVTGIELLPAGTVLGDEHAAILKGVKPEKVRFACLAPADLDAFELVIEPLPPLPFVKRTGPRVLVVDDAEFIRVLLTRVLRGGGYEVEVADDGETAIARAREGGLDLITLDVGMPRVDGLTALRELQKLAPDAKVLMVSAQSSPEVIAAAQAAGASEFLPKPVVATDLLAAAHRALGPRGLAAWQRGR